ncbi:zinc finger protein 569-like [Branchiostoma lanceolatum]|uniref:zinc finger protein 569-like n=1 Tax=Branchiostoma lanceolatum TaxID=7740 RepID=UPI00345563D6
MTRGWGGRCRAHDCGEGVRSQDVYPDKAIEREILSMAIFCSNVDDGCKWEGVVRHFMGHLSECDFEKTPCVNAEQGCRANISRKNLANHLQSDCEYRPVTCQWCRETTPHKEHKAHRQTCPAALVQCDWCGKGGLTRAQRREHQQPETGDCPNMKIPRSFEPMGCKEREHSDKGMEREIPSKGILCSNVGDGCKWEGIVRHLTVHLSECDFEKIPCVNAGQGCRASISRKNLPNHLQSDCEYRPVTCQWCRETTHHKEHKAHRQTCPAALVQCDWCGKGGLTRAQRREHQQPETGDCPNMKIACSFEPMGCTERVQIESSGLDPVRCGWCGKEDLTLAELQRHQHPDTGNCSNMNIPCTFSPFGCTEMTQTGAAVDRQQNTRGLPSNVSTHVAEQHPSEGLQFRRTATDADDNVMQRPEQQPDTAPTPALHATSGAPVEQETTDPEMQRGRIIELQKKVAMLKNQRFMLLKNREMLSQGFCDAQVEQETTDSEMQRGRIIELEKEVVMLENVLCVLRKDCKMLSRTQTDT